MNELGLQRLVLSSVKKKGGFGIKMSNRFLVGIPDLLLQLQGYPTTIWEAKKWREPTYGARVIPKVTPAQWRFLNEFYKHGGICGVIMFLVGNQNLHFGIFDLPKVKSGVYANEKDFTILPRGHREDTIFSILKREHDRYDEYYRTPKEPGQQPRGLQGNSEDSAVDQGSVAVGAGVA